MKTPLARVFPILMVLVCVSLQAFAHNKVVVIPMSGDDLKPLKNVITVAKGNGDFTDPIAAIASISDASESNPYLVIIAPGAYMLNGPIIMKPYIDIAGSGVGITRLSGSTEVVTLASNSRLSGLSIASIGGGSSSVAVSNAGSISGAELIDLDISASGGSVSNDALALGAASINLRHLRLRASGANAQALTLNQSTVEMNSVNASAIGGNGGSSYGISALETTLTMTQVTADANGGSVGYGLAIERGSQAQVRQSFLSGQSAGMVVSSAQFSRPAGLANAAHSTIKNGVVANGVVICAAVDDGNGALLDAMCQ